MDHPRLSLPKRPRQSDPHTYTHMGMPSIHATFLLSNTVVLSSLTSTPRALLPPCSPLCVLLCVAQPLCPYVQQLFPGLVSRRGSAAAPKLLGRLWAPARAKDGPLVPQVSTRSTESSRHAKHDRRRTGGGSSCSPRLVCGCCRGTHGTGRCARYWHKPSCTATSQRAGDCVSIAGDAPGPAGRPSSTACAPPPAPRTLVLPRPQRPSGAPLVQRARGPRQRHSAAPRRAHQQRRLRPVTP